MWQCVFAFQLVTGGKPAAATLFRKPISNPGRLSVPTPSSTDGPTEVTSGLKAALQAHGKHGGKQIISFITVVICITYAVPMPCLCIVYSAP